ncbi:MAG TPA: acyloxyacyl hydrolase [Verrucomicrobiae bacterium]|nr:acyloxyacyl hydrolase [Verrucomicrobiae bacterium]
MRCILKLLGVVVLFAAFSVAAGEIKGLGVAVRGGTSLNDRTETFRQVMGAVEYDLPWRWDLGRGFQLQSRGDLGAGWLKGERQDGFVGTLGPSALLTRDDFPLSFETGSSPTYISRHHFGNRDFGGPFQFTTHAGLNWDVTGHVRFGYRYQHMSNAGIYRRNPGVNIHMLSLSYRF